MDKEKFPPGSIPPKRDIQVQCFPLYSVLAAIGNPHIDYFSLDIEGAEVPVLENLPWDRVNMTLLSIEVNHLDEIFPGDYTYLKTFLEHRGYKYKRTVEIDDFFYKEENDRFLKKKKKSKKNKEEL